MASQIKQPEGAFFKGPRAFPKRFQNGFPVGPRTERRAKENAKLNGNVKIRHCEIRLSGCQGRFLLSWAHSKKSRFLVTGADWQEAARCCLSCHQKIEAMSHAKMAKLVRAAIRGRKTVEASSVQGGN